MWGNPLVQELFMGFADALPIFLLGLLLGVFVAQDSSSQPDIAPDRITPTVIPIIGGVYLIGRYIGYTLLGVESAYLARPLDTALWTLGMGTWIGLIYWRLRAGVPAQTPLERALRFGGLVFGLNWACFIFFMPILFAMDWSDVVLRTVNDIIWVALGTSVAERWRAPHTEYGKQ